MHLQALNRTNRSHLYALPTDPELIQSQPPRSLSMQLQRIVSAVQPDLLTSADIAPFQLHIGKEPHMSVVQC